MNLTDDGPLTFRPLETLLKWNALRIAEGIRIVGSADVLKANAESYERGALGNSPFVVGSNDYKWVYKTYIPCRLTVGVAYEDQPLTNTAAAIVSHTLKIDANMELVMSMSDTFTVAQKKNNRMVTLYSADVSSHAGQTVYAWMSVAAGYGINLKIMYDHSFTISMDITGGVHMVGDDDGIIPELNTGGSAQIAELIQDVAELQAAISPEAEEAQNATIISLNARVVSLEAKNIELLDENTNIKHRLYLLETWVSHMN